MNNESLIDNVVEASQDVLDVRPKRVKKPRKAAPSTSDPKEELRRLVKQHRALTKAAVAVTNMSSDRKSQSTGEVIKCNIPYDIQIKFKELADEVARKAARKLETAMLQQLRQIPIYNVFLKKVYGFGPVVSAYLITEIDIHKAMKPSMLLRFCGMAVINGRLERRAKGVKSAYSAELRTALYNAFSSMWKNAIGHGKTLKYLQIWMDYKNRKLQLAKDGKVFNGQRHVSANGYAHSYGRNKATDVFLEDLYIVWRTLEGLEVWPSWYAAKLGYGHGGKICVNAPKKLTLEEALALVGDISEHPYEWKVDSL